MEEQRKVETAMNQVILDLDKSHLRRMQVDMHSCSAKCYSDNSKSMEEVHRCVQECSTKLIRASKVIEHEISRFQERLQRCASDCADNVNLKDSTSLDDLQRTELQRDYDRCIGECVKQSLSLLPSVVKKIKDMIGK